MAKRRLGERLLEAGLITEKQLSQALQAQQVSGEQLGTLLMRMGYLQEPDLLRTLCEDAGIPFSTLQDGQPEPDAVELVPEAMARAKTVVPLALKDGRILIAAADPFDFAMVQSLERTSGQRVALVGAPRDRILGLIDQTYRGKGAAPAPRQAAGAATAPEVKARVGGAAEVISAGSALPPVVHTPGLQRFERTTGSLEAYLSPPADNNNPLMERLGTGDRAEAIGTAAEIVDEIFQRGVAMGATDIHVEPMADTVAVRYRVDGILRQGPSFPKALQSSLLTRIKILAELNIAESRLPQDGRLRATAAGRDIDMRISTFPTMHGEDLVLRVLDKSQLSLKVERLGMSEEDRKLFHDIVTRPHGMVLITGPTGSGKTTTLYSALAAMNDGRRCILTLEDPIEYELPGIRQSQINVRAGLTFASGLRSLLRHDPDVILVGEMRDHETVQIGMSAAMTGHMVLTTLHTNTAAGAIPRLQDMGVEPFVIASTLQLCVAQRLIRSICKECKAEEHVPDSVRQRLGLGDVPLFHGRGCGSCGGTGYRGRVGIFELLPINEAVQECIYERKSAEEIERVANRPKLLDDGLNKVRAGITSLEELLRAVAA